MSFNYYCHNIRLASGSGISDDLFSRSLQSLSQVSTPDVVVQCGYECDAFEIAVSEALPSAASYGNSCDVFWDGARLDFPWPFAAGNTERSIKMRYETNIISSPNAQSDWAFAQNQTDRGLNISTLSTWSEDWTEEAQLGFCGPPAYVGSVRGPVTGINGFIPSGDSLGSTGGDYNACIIFTGWNGDDSTTFPLLRNTNRNPFITVSGASSGTVSQTTFFINVIGSVNDRQIQIIVGDSTYQTIETFDIGTVGEGRWFLLTCSVSSTGAIIPGSGSGNDFLASTTVSGLLSSNDGFSHSFSVTGSRLHNPGTTASVVGWGWSTNFGAAGGIFYGRPTFFYMASSSGQCSIAYLGYENGPELSTAQLSRLEDAFKQSFVGYAGPCWYGDHLLITEDVESESEITQPVLAQIHNLTADDLEMVSSVTQPYVDTDVIFADSLESVSSVTSPTLAEV